MNFSVPSHLPYPLWGVEISPEIELRSTHGAALAQLGYTLIFEDCPAEALEVLSKALALRPESSTIREWRATCYLELGDYEQALADLTDVVSLNPKYATAYNNRGLCYLLMGRTTEALTDLNTCITLNPEHVIAYANRAHAYCNLRQLSLALRSCNVGLALDDTNEELLSVRRRVLEMLATLEAGRQERDGH